MDKAKKKERVIVQATQGGYYNGYRNIGDVFYINSEDELSDRWMTTDVKKDAKLSDGTNDEQATQIDELKAQLAAANEKNAELEQAVKASKDAGSGSDPAKAPSQHPSPDGKPNASGDGKDGQQGKQNPSEK